MKKIIQSFQDVLKLESSALLGSIDRIRENDIMKAHQILSELDKKNGSLFFIGVGKSGFIAKKAASTFNSLGLPSYFLHPTDALHGELGLIRENDAIVLISNSGTTDEIINLLPFLPIKKESIIGLIGNEKSYIADHCEVVLNCYVEKEACINNQAPTASTTLALAITDALAVTYENITSLTSERFAKNHPAGKLGKSLSLKVEHIMVKESDCPFMSPDDLLINVLLEMTKKPVGACFIKKDDSFEGVLVEGDIRRILTKDQDALNKKIDGHVNTTPITVQKDSLASKALNLMQNRKSPISVLPVLDGEKLVGALRLYDILKAGL